MTAPQFTSSTGPAATALSELGYLRTQHIAEYSSVGIVPAFNSPPLQLLTGAVGPFRANLAIDVPLWLALSLRQSQRCRIECPSWLDATYLIQQCEREKADVSVFAALPYHYIETAHMLLTLARDDIPQADRCEELVRDVIELRRQKIHSGLMAWRTDTNTTLKLNHVAAMEVEGLRHMGGRALKQFHSLQTLQQQGVVGLGASSQQQRSVSQPSAGSQSSSLSQSNAFQSSQSGTQPPLRPLRRMRK